MADLDYTTINNPYDNSLIRGDALSNNFSSNVSQDELGGGGAIKSGGSLSDITINNFIKSRSYQPKKQGFLIDAMRGYIECMQLYVGDGGIIGGSIDIPDKTSTASFHVDSSGNMWSGAPTFAAANFSVTSTGVLDVTGGTITGGTIIGGTITGGTITGGAITGGTIDGTTITGGTVRTSSGSTRVVMNGSLNNLEYYVSGIKRASLSSTGLQFFDPSGTLSATISGLSGGSLSLAPSAGNLETFGDIVVSDGDVYPTVSGGADLGVEDTLEWNDLFVGGIKLNGVYRNSWPAAGTTTLSGLTIDTSKNWGGYYITSLGGIYFNPISSIYRSSSLVMQVQAEGSTWNKWVCKTDFIPYMDNNGSLGFRAGVGGQSVSYRWAEIHGVNIQSGDYAFDNNFRFTEEGDTGIALYNQNNIKIAVFNEDGNLLIKGQIIENIL